MDQDILLFLITLFFLFILYCINSSKWHYKTGVRYWVGTIFVSMGLSAFVINLLARDSKGLTYTLAAILYIILGASIWLIKGGKKENKKK